MEEKIKESIEIWEQLRKQHPTLSPSDVAILAIQHRQLREARRELQNNR